MKYRFVLAVEQRSSRTQHTITTQTISYSRAVDKQGQEHWLGAWAPGLFLELESRLTMPLLVPNPGNYWCPTLGFGGGCISPQEDSHCFRLPEDRFYTAEDARQVILNNYGDNIF